MSQKVDGAPVMTLADPCDIVTALERAAKRFKAETRTPAVVVLDEFHSASQEREALGPRARSLCGHLVICSPFLVMRFTSTSTSCPLSPRGWLLFPRGWLLQL